MTDQNQEIELTILMPCLNEADSLPYCLEKARFFLHQNNIQGEIIISDNGSTDNSVNISLEQNAIVVSEPEKGYGNAIMKGIEKSRGKFIIIGDADDSYDFSDLMPFLELLRKGNDMVIGNRFKGGIKKNAMPFLHKYFGNPFLSFVGRIFFKINIKDFHCGLRGIVKTKFEQLDIKSTGMEFASEMIVKAALNNYKIAEMPIVLYPDKRNRPSHLKTWSDGWRHLRFLLLYSPKWLFLFPGIVLMIFGIAGTVLLSMGPIRLANKNFDVHTMLYTSAFILMGFQFIFFYLFSRVYAVTHGLLPLKNKFLKNFNKYFKMEKGILTGTLLIIGGIFLFLKSFIYWKNSDFGNLDPVIVLRWVTPSTILIVLGLQIITSSFYLSIILIKSRN